MFIKKFSLWNEADGEGGDLGGAGGGSHSNEDVVDVEELKGQLAQLQGEVSKLRSQKNEIAKQRDELKKGKTASDTENYKSLWEQEKQERDRLTNQVRSSAIDAAVRTRLSKIGVLPDAIDAAAKLIDEKMVVWDAEEGVDSTSVDGAVAKLKNEYKFMFEKKVPSTTPKTPADGGGQSGEKTIKRSDFEKLTPADRMKKMKDGWTLQD